MKAIKLKKRSMAEMVTLFNQTVANMDIPQSYKLELLGMITAIGQRYDEDVPQWIPCSEKLPNPKELVLVNISIKNAPWSIVLMRGVYAIDSYEKGQINAWMPLPEPYKEEVRE